MFKWFQTFYFLYFGESQTIPLYIIIFFGFPLFLVVEENEKEQSHFVEQG